MKKFQVIIIVIMILLVGIKTTYSQLMNIQKFIGKSPKDLIAAIGKPVIFDDTNPSKIFMNYNLLSLVCQADQKGIYEAEITKNYTSKLEAAEEINEMISVLESEGSIQDSISENHYDLYSPGVKTEIQLIELPDNPNMVLKIKSIRQMN